MTTHLLQAALASGGTNFTVIGVWTAICFAVCVLLSVVAWNYYQLQRHRADAVAMAAYRQLAEQAVADLAGLRAEMAKLAEHVSAVEQLMRDVG